MVDGCLEEDGWWSIRVVRWKGKGELEGEVGIWSIIRSLDGRSPGLKISVGGWEGRYARSSGGHKLHQLGL